MSRLKIVVLVGLALVGGIGIWLWLDLRFHLDSLMERSTALGIEDHLDAWIDQLQDRSGTAGRLASEIVRADDLESQDQILERLAEQASSIDEKGARRNAAAVLEELTPAASPSDQERLRAIVEMVLGPLYFDALTEQRIDAARSLGLLGYEAAIDPLVELMRDPLEHLELRRTAAEALREMGDERAEQALDTYWYGVDDAATKRASETFLPDDIVSRLLMLSHENPKEVRRAYEECQEKLDDRILLAYIAALEHRDERLRWAAARCLSGCRDTRALTPLRRTARRDPDERVREAARRSLETVELNIR
jgi:HEAT repeat protein